MTEEKKNLGLELIKLLGLPEYVERLEIVFEGNFPPVVRCSYMLVGASDEIIKQFAEFKLVRKEDSQAS